jgi:hypothetical protein
MSPSKSAVAIVRCACGAGGREDDGEERQERGQREEWGKHNIRSGRDMDGEEERAGECRGEGLEVKES